MGMFGGGNSRAKDFERPPRPGAAPARDHNLLDRDDALEDRFGVRAEVEPAPATSFPSYLGQSPRSGATPLEGCASVIAAGCQWKGTLTVDSSIRVEGQVSGEINAKDTVHIAEGAKVDAKVQAAYVVVAGSFQGQMRCKEKLELLPKSRVRGEISAKLLSVHEGAFIDGHVQMAGEEAVAPAPKTAASAGSSRSSATNARSTPEPVAAVLSAVPDPDADLESND